ncbi:hypothetical protein [Gulosibacter molinativorax]|uniref:Helicase XPB/Ssl2 N-terminal domain-containing protein n=1 Tax=Gulosibacter molinativorax TaxID=256821 RepID=A0ABT7C996_9MICO|nr:hypothetical protein [Gulosibacter molinativorax]MDJ1371683.1 hypothetical protein [Gulosibacter molinativorax]QUY63105.1 Hypotetical protein [Gulosibacter molinativorax]
MRDDIIANSDDVDPEFFEELARRGIQRKTGMAEDLLEELAPLLKAEGIDLDDPDNPPDLDILNAAMAVAVERRNMELFTPIGLYRDLALAVLRDITIAIASGNADDAVDIHDSIEPEESETRPAGSHLIGVSLGLLDEWYSDPALTRELARASVPKLFSKPGRNLARDIVSLAMKGRATATTGQLIARNGGFVVSEAGVLAVAGAVIVMAKSRGMDVASLATELLTATELPANRTGAAFIKEPPTDFGGEPLLLGFREWLSAGGGFDEDAEVIHHLLVDLFGYMREQGRPIEEPSDVEMLSYTFDETYPDADANLISNGLMAIDALVHFHLETSPNRADWEDVHDAIEAPPLSELDMSGLVEWAEEDAKGLTASVREKAFAKTKLYKATLELVDWLGEKGQPVTSIGAPRRADIERVAGMLGIRAVGVAKRTARESPFEELQVQSAFDIRELVMWWDALRVSGAIEVLATKVKRGPTGSNWDGAGSVPADASDDLITALVESRTWYECVFEDEPGQIEYDDLALGLIVAHFTSALKGVPLMDLGEEVTVVMLAEMQARRVLNDFADLGLVERHGEEFRVPREWRLPIARGLDQITRRLQTL